MDKCRNGVFVFFLIVEGMMGSFDKVGYEIGFEVIVGKFIGFWVMEEYKGGCDLEGLFL